MSTRDREKIDYRDSQRPYQIPDGMDAYIVEAYADEIAATLPVVNVITNERITFTGLIKIITGRLTPDLSDNRQTFIDHRTTTVIEKYDTNVASRVPLQVNGRQ